MLRVSVLMNKFFTARPELEYVSIGSSVTSGVVPFHRVFKCIHHALRLRTSTFSICEAEQVCCVSIFRSYAS